MNEELKIKVSVDTSGVDAGVARAKKSLKSLGDSTKASMKGATAGASEGFEDLRNSIDQIRNLQFGDMIGKQLDKISGHAKLAASAFSNLFSAKYWKGAKENIHSFSDLISTIGTEGKEAWASFKTAGKAALDAIHIKLIAVVGAVVALVATIKNAFSTANQIKTLNNEAAKVGLSVNAYQEWSYIMEKTGSDAGVLGDAIKTLSAEQLEVRKGTEDAIAKFEALGLSMETVMNMSQEELLSETVKRLQNVRDEVERTSLAYRIFGEEDAAQMANVLRLTNAETAEMAATVHLLGNTISGDLLAKSQALSGAVSSMKMAWQGLTNTLAELFMPVITTIVNAITKALVVVNLFLKTIFGLDMTPAASSIGAATGNVGALTDGLSGVGDAADAATGAVEKLKRSTMGFDELNIVANPKSASSGSGADGGASGGVDLGGGGFTETESAFDKAKGKIEEFQQKVQDFLDKWKTEIQIIAGALGVLGIANLLTGLGKAVGLSETFLSKLNLIKKIATTAITIVLQYSLVNEFMDNYIDGEGFKEFLKGLLVSALGTAVLYATWGTAGLVIGLGVTAVASLKAVLDNGGITNVESLTVALTGLATAIGAVGLAWKKLGLTALITKAAGNVGAFIALLKEGNSLGSVLAASFPKVANAIAAIGTAIKGIPAVFKGVLAGIAGFGKSVAAGLSGAVSALGSFAGAIGSVFSLTGGAAIAAGAAVIAAAIAAIVGVVVFLKENWEAMGNVVEGFFQKNIAPRLEAIKESFQNIKNSLAGVGKAILDALPDSVVQWLKDAWHWITELVKKIGEWFASIDWIKGIGEVFEYIGGVIVAVVGGAIAGAIDAFVGLIQGAIRVIEGVVDIVSGVVTAVVKLFSGDLQAAGDAVKKIGEGIVKVFEGLYNSTIGIVVNWVKGIIDWCEQMWDELVGHSIIPDMCDAIINCFKTMFTNVINGIKDWVNNVLQKCKDLWNSLKNWFTSNVAPKFTKQYWTNKLDTIRQAAQEKITAAKTAIANIWSGIVSWFNSSVAPKFTKQYWANKLDTVRAAAQEKLTAAKNTITSIWDSVKNWFNTSVAPKFTVSYWTDKFNCIKEGGKAAMNGLLGIVEKAINWMVDKLNKFRISIPSWVPEIGGKSFGISLSRVSIPRLAEGGIATRSIFANIGERGKEAVLPLEHNTQWMDLLADRIAARSGGAPTKIVLKVGERELGYAVIDAINQNTKQTGGLKLQLV